MKGAGMTQKTENFNLLEEEWIPVLWRDGQFSRVGIREALTKAGRIHQIAASNPMDNVSLLRLLLAVVHWCKPTLSDQERARLESAEGIPHGWLDDKLGTEKRPNPAFNLLGDPTAYNQLLPVNTKTDSGTNALLHELPSGTNIAHFRHIRDKQVLLCLACCALGLTRLPAFTTSRGPGNYPAINQVPPIYFLPSLGTMVRTLLYNWKSQHLPFDRPAWSHPALVSSDEKDVGILEGLTWIDRRVRIAAPSANGACAFCGMATDVATVIAFQKPLKDEVERMKRRILNKKWRDPHVAYTKEPQKSKSDAVDTGSAKALDCLNYPWSAAGEWRQLWSATLGPSTDEYVGPPWWLVKGDRMTEAGGVESRIVWTETG